jgi:hypothetical protein
MLEKADMAEMLEKADAEMAEKADVAVEKGGALDLGVQFGSTMYSFSHRMVVFLASASSYKSPSPAGWSSFNFSNLPITSSTPATA